MMSAVATQLDSRTDLKAVPAARRREPLLLLHGLTSSAQIWADVEPHLRDDFDVIIPNAPGHRGGPAVEGRASVRGLIDMTERVLDDRGITRAHIAGNSLGGWTAIELARRGRALSVCALSPAGFWPGADRRSLRGVRKLRRLRYAAILSLPMAPLAMRIALVRKLALRDVARHGERFTPAQAVQAVRDMVACSVTREIFATRDSVETLDPAPCPITLAWAEHDRILPPDICAPVAKQRIAGARYIELADVGHVPMIDDPRLCAETIRAACVAAR